MDYDAYGRPVRGSGGYFDDTLPPTDSRHYEQRDSSPNIQHKWNHAQQRYSPPILNHERMPSGPPEPPIVQAHENVSPEIIAAITERVKREVMEHLKATGGVENPPKEKGPPMQRQHSSSNSSRSSPPLQQSRGVYTPPSPAHSHPPKPTYTEPVKSPPLSPLDKPSSVRFNERAQPRPVAGGKSYSTAELSTVDQKWGRLFESDGLPTQRLGQFLRGLANHIIDDLPPKKSIVVTPAKMAAFYATHALDKEPHPLLSIFRAQSNEHISNLYQDLGCQHHLIQEQNSLPCVVPSLTAVGFAHWMTLHILAYPEEEWKRLEKIVCTMPVNADGDLVDGKPERLPKQISRYLLPELEDRKSRKRLDTAIHDFLEDIGSAPARKKSITNSPPPPLNRQPSISQRRNSSSNRQTRPPVEIHQDIKSPPAPKGSNIERERMPYSGAPGSDVSSNDEGGIKIERERQPYTAQPGTGRVYENLKSPDRGPRDRANSASRPNDTDFPDPRHTRTHSDARRDQYMGPPPARSGTRRPSSPPLKNFSNSTPIDINSSSASYGPGPSTSASSFTPNPSTFSPRPYGSGASAFPPPPPPMDSRGERREAYTGRRIPDDDPSRVSGDFNSPRDAERWDRYQESRASGDGFGVPYERGSVSIDPRDGVPLTSRGGTNEDWYREKPRGQGYDDFRRYG